MLGGQGHDVHGSDSDGREESGLPLVKLVLKGQEGWSDFRSRGGGDRETSGGRERN